MRWRQPKPALLIAIAHLEAIRDFNPRNPEVYVMLDNAYKQQGQTRARQQSWDRADQYANEDEYWPQIGKARLLIDEGHTSEALRYFEDLLALDPDNPDLWHYHAIVLLQANRIEDSFIATDNAFNLNPSSAQYRKSIADYEIWGSAEQYHMLITRNLGGNPDRAWTYYKFGQILIDQKDYETAAQELGWARELAPDVGLYNLERAKAFILWAGVAQSNQAELLANARAELDTAAQLSLIELQYADELSLMLLEQR